MNINRILNILQKICYFLYKNKSPPHRRTLNIYQLRLNKFFNDNVLYSIFWRFIVTFQPVFTLYFVPFLWLQNIVLSFCYHNQAYGFFQLLLPRAANRYAFSVLLNPGLLSMYAITSDFESVPFAFPPLPIPSASISPPNTS